MQNVCVFSSLTYECTHVTPSSALRPTTAPHTAAPSSLIGMRSPSGNVRCTRYRCIYDLLLYGPHDMPPSYAHTTPQTSGGPPILLKPAPINALPYEQRSGNRPTADVIELSPSLTTRPH